MQFILQWLDFIWLPLAFVSVRKDQRFWVLGFFIGCMVMMRLQVELMDSTGFNNGFLGLLVYGAQARGVVVYSLFYVFFLVWALFSPYAKGTILMAASISVFFAALFTSMIVMCL